MSDEDYVVSPRGACAVNVYTSIPPRARSAQDETPMRNTSIVKGNNGGRCQLLFFKSYEIERCESILDLTTDVCEGVKHITAAMQTHRSPDIACDLR